MAVAATAAHSQAKDVVAHAIVLISAKGDGLQVQITRALSEGTGGTYNTTATGGDLAVRFAAIAQNIVADYDRTSTQYLLDTRPRRASRAPI